MLMALQVNHEGRVGFEGNTLINLAARSGRVKVVRLLVEQQANVNVADVGGAEPYIVVVVDGGTVAVVVADGDTVVVDSNTCCCCCCCL